MRIPFRSLVVASLSVVVIGVALPAAASPGFVEQSSANPVTAAPPPTRPAGAHCTVTLADRFPSNATDGSPQDFAGTLTPPATCPGPWAKVLLTERISVSGRQFDRVGTLTVGDVQIYRGTTEEPSGPKPIHYTVTKDVTPYTALLRSTQPFNGGIANYTSDVYTGVYLQTVQLTYYRTDATHPAPATADRVVSLGDNALSPATPSVDRRVTGLPRNIVHATLQTTLEGGGCDEQWFDAVPDSVATQYPSAGLCGHGPYREAEVSLDGHPVAALHTFPHIYSGGIVPTLWRPIPAIGTFDLHAETADVTPFVGLLVDGRAHHFGIGIQDINDNWNAVATLFLWTDQRAARTHGALTTDDVATTAPTQTGVADVDGGVQATVTAARHDVTAGWVATSAGRVTTTVSRSMTFRSVDTVTDGGLVQAVRQDDHGGETSVSRRAGVVTAGTQRHYSYPLAVDFSAAQYVDDQNFALTGHVTMNRTVRDEVRTADGWHVVAASTEVVDTDGILARTDGVTSQSDGRSTSTFAGTDDQGRPYRHYLASRRVQQQVDVIECDNGPSYLSSRVIYRVPTTAATGCDPWCGRDRESGRVQRLRECRRARPWPRLWWPG